MSMLCSATPDLGPATSNPEPDPEQLTADKSGQDPSALDKSTSHVHDANESNKDISFFGTTASHVQTNSPQLETSASSKSNITIIDSAASDLEQAPLLCEAGSNHDAGTLNVDPVDPNGIKSPCQLGSDLSQKRPALPDKSQEPSRRVTRLSAASKNKLLWKAQSPLGFLLARRLNVWLLKRQDLAGL